MIEALLSVCLLAALLALGALLAVGDASERRRMRALRARVALSEHPAMLARFSGEVVLANPAMRAQSGPGPARTVADALAACLERCGAAAIYRLSQTARGLGFAVMPVVLRASGDPRYLVVCAPSDDLQVWSLVDTAMLSDMLPSFARSRYEQAPFAHMQRAGAEPAVLNAAFRRLFGPDPAPVLAALPADGDATGETVLLTARDGRVRLFRAFRSRDGTGGDGTGDHGTGDDELFLFEVPAEAQSRSGAARALELAPVALAQFETDGTLLWCNSRARAILGARAAPGARLSELVVAFGQPGGAGDAERLSAMSASSARGQMVQLRGSDTFLQIALSRVPLSGRETYLAVLTDASQLRQLEDQFAQSQKMEAIGKLAGGVAHDFNNVLTAIVGHCDLLLLRKDPSHPDYADLMQITQNANRAGALVRQLLAFSRKQTLNPEVLAVEEVVAETHYLLNRLVGESVRLVLASEGSLWPVRADHQQLEQVLMNLVVNARDAMEGAGTVTISLANTVLRAAAAAAGAREPEGEFVEIRVTDTGPGIDPRVLDKVFDPFFTTKPKGEGTGLGLSTVYGIVKQSGGFIFAENAAEGGASFRVLLPRAVDQPAAPAVPPDAATAGPPRRDLTGRGTILLVEDEHPVRAFAARALKLRGYDVVEAETAEAAMETLSDPGLHVDLIVSDVVMPGMDGPTFAREARSLRPGLRIVFVSGYAEESFRENLGDTDFLFLPKPFSLNELTARVKEALGEAPVG